MQINLAGRHFEFTWLTRRSFWIEGPIIGAMHLTYRDLPHSPKFFDIVRHETGDREVFIGGSGRHRLHAVWSPSAPLARLASS